MSLAESIEPPTQQVSTTGSKEEDIPSSAMETAVEQPLQSEEPAAAAATAKPASTDSKPTAKKTKPQPGQAAKKQPATTEKPKKEPRKRDRKSTTKKVKKPSKIIKLRIANNEPAPTFEELENTGTLECFWLRVQIREFLLRFDKLCRIPSRYLPTLNDLTAPWTDQLYKSVIVSLLRMFSYDRTWLIPLAKQYIPIVEDCPAESFELWTYLEDFLIANDPYVGKATSLTGEHFRLELIRRLLTLTTSTETIRSTVINDHESLLTLKKENAEQIKVFQDQFNAKIEQLKQNKETFADKKANAERVTTEKIFKAEQTMYSRLRKYSLRTSPVGKDNFGNTYWILQQKGKEMWGSSVLCEMKVFPDDEEKMVLQEEDESKEEKDEETGEIKRKRRRYVVKKRDFLSDRDSSLHYVTGQDNILTLASWIRGQIGIKQDALASEIETMAYYSCMD